MMLIPCPHCGPRAQAEFTYERTRDSLVVPGMESAEAMEVLYTRTNPRGPDAELWRHTYGCRSWIELNRHRVTHEILSVRTIA